MAKMLAWLIRIYIVYRWARITTRQYGMFYVFLERRPRHAAIGRGVVRDTGMHTKAITGWNMPSGELVMALQEERKFAHV